MARMRRQARLHHSGLPGEIHEDVLERPLLRVHGEDLALGHPALEASGVGRVVEAQALLLARVEQHDGGALPVAQLELARRVEGDDAPEARKATRSQSSSASSM